MAGDDTFVALHTATVVTERRADVRLMVAGAAMVKWWYSYGWSRTWRERGGGGKRAMLEICNFNNEKGDERFGGKNRRDEL
ncbi:hypothetical protein E3N88_05190 [Mikania micrantha]|uniref:Uncharacterized protein n=1 Tax=Mikania micrantha TaxID=192012 RepID=A0A5N6PX22_9ASTR|nr:hypothetical protein E3N88_05190 [Mikania micrantha]